MTSASATITADQIASAVGAEASDELQQAIKKIRHCVNQLSDEQVWWRPDELQNSIGNLILHLCGNVRQWIISGLGGEQDVRNRSQEFSERRATPKADLVGQLEMVVAEATKVLSVVTASELLRVQRIQGFDETGMAAIFSTVPHFRGHTQEIVHMTRSLLGDAYRFSWKPQTPEQGAPA